jgi:hypothetical protein
MTANLNYTVVTLFLNYKFKKMFLSFHFNLNIITCLVSVKNKKNIGAPFV